MVLHTLGAVSLGALVLCVNIHTVAGAIALVVMAVCCIPAAFNDCCLHLAAGNAIVGKDQMVPVTAVL
jgi:hypothetical protein